MSMTDDLSVDGALPTRGEPEARRLRREFFDDEMLDKLIGASGERGVALTGEGGFLPEMIKAVLERGMKVELSDHLGYEQGDPAGRGSGNSRNGSTPKTVATEVGDVRLDQPRDRAGTFASALVPKGARRLGGLENMIISLYAGGMTIRDIQHIWRRRSALSCPTRRSATSPTPSLRRSRPGSPARWRRSTQSSSWTPWS